MHGIRVAAATAEAFLEQGHKRVVCTLNGDTTIHRALSPIKGGGHYVIVGKKVLKTLGVEAGDFVTATLATDTSKHQFEMPEALAAVFETDPDADGIFQSLSPGNQRGLMYLVTAVKSTDKQIERALKIADRLKMGVTSPRDILKRHT